MADHPRHTRLRGYDVCVADHGSGPDVVVLVHGIGVSRRTFGPLSKVLSAGRRVLAPDLPGFGTSRGPRDVLTIEEHASVIEQLIREEGLERPTLVGHSMGAQVVAEVAARNPELAERVILIGPVVEPGTRSAARQAWRLIRDARFEPRDANMIMLTDWFRAGPRRYFATVPSMVEYPLEDRLARITVPVVLVRGEHDPVTPLDYLHHLAVLTPDATVVEVPGAGHMAMYCRPELVAHLCVGVRT